MFLSKLLESNKNIWSVHWVTTSTLAMWSGEKTAAYCGRKKRCNAHDLTWEDLKQKQSFDFALLVQWTEKLSAHFPHTGMDIMRLVKIQHTKNKLGMRCWQRIAVIFVYTSLYIAWKVPEEGRVLLCSSRMFYFFNCSHQTISDVFF